MPALLPPARTRLAGSACWRATPRPLISHLQQHRPFSASTIRRNSDSTATNPPSSSDPNPNPQTLAERFPFPPPPARWISDLPARIGKCLAFGCDARQISQAAAVLRAIATEWRDLLAGSEGFLTGGRRGLDAREIAWGEMDSFGHVNNVNYYRYAESARVNWITNFAVHVDPAHREQWRELMSPKSTGLIMKSLKADFKFPIVYPDKISVYHKLRAQTPSDPAAAPSSFALDCIVLSHQHRRVACRLEEDIVVYDYRAGGKTAMSAYMLKLFEQTWQLQQDVTVKARARIAGLHMAVKQLEGETWDREGAVEDMGGGSKGV